jgi:D-alanine--poly(phosphoribitol) ligase subunit 2
LLDSLSTVELMLALSREFGLEISPAEFDRDEWSTPQRIVADVQARLARRQAGARA